MEVRGKYSECRRDERTKDDVVGEEGEKRRSKRRSDGD